MSPGGQFPWEDGGAGAGVLALAAAAGYLLGSVPIGHFVASARGVDIFKAGSCNPGATNVRRVLGAGPGNLVFALDALKGALAAGWPLLLLWQAAAGAVPPVPASSAEAARALGVVGLAFALVGHSFSCFTHFRGGKGVATAAGAFLVLMPLGTVAAAAVWGAAFFSSRYVSVASILAALSLPVTSLLAGEGVLVTVAAVAAAIFVVARHRDNIGRLFRGTENRAGRARGGGAP